MKTVKDKYLVVGADFAGFPIKMVKNIPLTAFLPDKIFL